MNKRRIIIWVIVIVITIFIQKYYVPSLNTDTFGNRLFVAYIYVTYIIGLCIILYNVYIIVTKEMML